MSRSSDRADLIRSARKTITADQVVNKLRQRAFKFTVGREFDRYDTAVALVEEAIVAIAEGKP